MKVRIAANIITLLVLLAASPMASSLTIPGTIRDFCVEDFAVPAGCTPHPDFEFLITGQVNGMVGSSLVGGVPVYVATPTFGGVNSAATFAQWYADVPGTNLSQAFSLDLTETAPGSGIFEFSDSSFFPIDGALFGNQGQPHNYHFTLELHAQTSFDPTDMFNFTGDDDLWVFVNGLLALDIGGVHGAVSKSFIGQDLIDDLGLSAGTLYDLDIFFAERHTIASNFNITTSLQIMTPPVPEPATVALLGLGLLLVGYRQAARARR